mgnify:CR=1 FL=1
MVNSPSFQKYYYDKEDNQIALSLGQYGEQRKYDTEGNNYITTYIDDAGNEHQIAAYYDYYGTIVLAKRVNEGQWFYEWTGLKGDITDAHNTISVAVDGDGYIHLGMGNQHVEV